MSSATIAPGSFIVASGYCWSSHLLLLSANSRFPKGVANSSGLVGPLHDRACLRRGAATIDEQTFPGQHRAHSLISREYFRCAADKPFVRHDTRVWEDSTGREPRLRDDAGKLLLGDEVFDDWRPRTKGSSVRLRTYLDVHPSADSRLTLNPRRRTATAIRCRRSNIASTRRPTPGSRPTRSTFATCSRARQGQQRQGRQHERRRLPGSPGGGCRMGTDPSTSVCDSYGRTHDHENLYVIGAPTVPTGGCTNGTLTFVALTLRSADRIASTLARV